MASLAIKCRFVAHNYTGIRQGASGRDEIDWPPAPARLHQALLATAMANVPISMRAQYSDETLAALIWLESLAPPEISASKLLDDGYRRVLVAMPHNSPAKEDLSRYHPDLAPVFRATPELDGTLSVNYWWLGEGDGFLRDAEQHLPAIREAAAELCYLGRAEDRVECSVVWHTEDFIPPINESMESWRPSVNVGDAHLLATGHGTTDALMRRFEAASRRPEREANPPARLCLLSQSYARDAAGALVPIHVAIFHVVRSTGSPDQPFEVCDSTNAHRWRSPLRALACAVARDRGRWNDHALALELISGHAPDGARTKRPHLAFVPLPSLSLSGQADGRVRRFALLGYAEGDLAAATSVYQTLAAALDLEEVEPGYRLERVADLHRDRLWSLYGRTSRSWASATPLLIGRHYKVPTHTPNGTPISNNERQIRRLTELASLVRGSMRDMQMPLGVAKRSKITLTASPLLVGTERADRYRAPGETALPIHARLDFEDLVRGPLLLGDRRYQGLGLFFPLDV